MKHSSDEQRDASSEGPVLCRLSYRDALGEESSLVVGDRPVKIGRSLHCDLVLGHESVSREHAEISHCEGGWEVSDLGSKNGLKVNTYRTRRQLLRDGDCIDVGTIKLWVDIGAVPQAGRARVVWEPATDRAPAEVLDMDRLDSLFMSTPDLSLSLSPLLPRTPAPAPASAKKNDSDSLDIPASLEEPAGLLGVFSQAAEALLTCDTLDQTLERILELVFDKLTAERGVICLYDEETDTTTPKVMRTREGIPDEPIAISTNIANDCIKQRQALLVRDAGIDPRFGGAESIVAMCIRSAMCAPLYREGRVVGFIYVDQQSELHAFTAAQLQSLSTVAILSAVAVEQAALRDRVRHEQNIRDRLARYSSPAVVDRIISAPGSAPGVVERGMAAEEGDVTVLFADITGFTPLAEQLHPREVVAVLNHIFERLTEEVFALEGTLDKFRGDGMMAFFGAPLPMPDHAARAVECALRMQERLAELNAESDAHREIAMRIGINSGTVVIGDIGSPQRKDYTVIGDVVNTASRLESSVAKPGQVVLGHATWQRVRDRYECEAMEEVFVKGKRQQVRPYRAIRRLA